MRYLQRTVRALLALLAIVASTAPLSAAAADCGAFDEASFLACAAGPGAGDTITLSANITLTGATPTLVATDKTLVQGAFRLFGTLRKTGAAALTINAANSLGVVEITAGTIFVSATNALGSGALVMSGGQLISTGLVSLSFVTLDFTAGILSRISADSGQTIGLNVTSVTLQAASQAVFGEPGRNGSVFLAPGASSSAAADSTILIDGASFTAGSPNFTLLSGSAASVTIRNTGGLGSNGNNFTIANLQAPDRFASLNIAIPGNVVAVASGNFPGSIGGGGTLQKVGAGTLVLSGIIGHTGGTSISAGGPLQLGDGSGTNQNYNLNIVNNGRLVISTAAANFTLGGSVTGFGGIEKEGPGAFNFNATGTYSGATNVNGGVLRLGSPASTATTDLIALNLNARLQATSSFTLDRRIVLLSGTAPGICVANGQVLTLTGEIVGSVPTFVVNDCSTSGTLLLAGPSSSQPTNLQVVGGELQANDAYTGFLLQPASQLNVQGPATLRSSRTFGTLQVRGLSGTGNVVNEQATLELIGGTFDGVISGAGGVRTGGSTVTLTNDNTYTGTTEVLSNLNIGNGGGTGSTGTGPINAIALLQYNRTGTLDIPNTLSGNSIQFSGGGTFILSGTGPISGNFRPSPNATVVVTGTYPAARPQMNGAGAILRGTGTVQGFLAGAGAIVEPGVDAGTGIFPVGLASLIGGTVNVKINGPTAGTQYDQFQVSSWASFANAPLNVVLGGGYVPAPGTSFTIMDVGSGSTPGGFTGLGEGAMFTSGGAMFRVTYQGGTGNDVVLTAVTVPDAPTITNVTLLNATDVRVAFTAPAQTGGTPILDYTVSCGSSTDNGVLASPHDILGLSAGPTTCVVRARNAVGFSADSAPFPVTTGSFSASGPSATGSGTITAMVSGGGASCSFGFPPSFVPVSAVPDTPPANTDFPHGLAGLYASGCTPGSTITFTIIYPAPLPAGTQYWVYGPTAAIPAQHWYTLPPSVANISGNTVTLTITDNVDGDFEPTAGIIAVGGGPGVPVAIPPASPPPPVSLGNAYQGLWWAGSAESGWGVNTTQQGSILFVTWFTYGADGQGQWFLMSNAQQTAPGVFTGTIYTTRGPAFSSVPFDSRQVVTTEVGMGTLTFTSPTAGTFDYTVNGITQSKALSRLQFGDVVPECTVGGTPGTIVNYQDTWWNPGESGWGLTIAHQGDVIFATWFTYDASGKAQWLLMSNVRRVGLSDQFKGSIYRTTGNAFSSQPWNRDSIHVTEVGTVTLTFSGRNSGTFAYTLDGVSQVKSIERTDFASPKAMCRFP